LKPAFSNTLRNLPAGIGTIFVSLTPRFDALSKNVWTKIRRLTPFKMKNPSAFAHGRDGLEEMALPK